MKRAGLQMEILNEAAEAKLIGDRELGKLLAMMPKARGVRMDGKDDKGEFRRSHDATAEAPTYTDLGIHKTKAARWQQAASVPCHPVTRLG